MENHRNAVVSRVPRKYASRSEFCFFLFPFPVDLLDSGPRGFFQSKFPLALGRRGDGEEERSTQTVLIKKLGTPSKETPLLPSVSSNCPLIVGGGAAAGPPGGTPCETFQLSLDLQLSFDLEPD